MIRRLGARYELQEPIGGGGMAVVYRAVDTLLDRTVAVKMLRPQYAGDDEFVSRFRQEAQSAARLSHPNIVNLYDIGVSNNEYYLVMEYVDGPTLKDVIRKSAPMEVEDVIQISMQICDAIEHAHNRQIIHRDIKPHNILLNKSGQVKVTDFGIARAITGNTITYQQATSVLGSVHYFSPEQARGAVADVKSDIYSLGVVMYEMVTNELPFSGDTPVSIALKHLQAHFVEPRALFPEIPQSLENVILRCLVKTPEHRYATMRAVKADLQEALLNPDVPKFEMPGDDLVDATISMPALGGILEMEDDADGDVPVAPPPRRRFRVARVLLGTVIGLFVLVVAAVAAYYIEFVLLNRVPTLTMPNVVGETETKALQRLEAGKFLQPNIHEKRDFNNLPAGVVYKQDPRGPSTVMQTRDIYLYVSRGPVHVAMPNFQSYPIAQAIQELKNLGFSEQNILQQHMYSDTIDKNAVISTVPASGSTVAINQQVVVTVSDGPQLTVPNVIGLTLKDAKQYILDEHLTVNPVVIFEAAPGYQNQTVLNTGPYPPGTPVKAGTQITLYVAENGVSGGASQVGGNNQASGANGGAGGGTGTSTGGTTTPTTGGLGNANQTTATTGDATNSTSSGASSGGSGNGQTISNRAGSGIGAGVPSTTPGETQSGPPGTSMVPVQVFVTHHGKHVVPVIVQVLDATSTQTRVALSTSIDASQSWTIPVYVTQALGAQVWVYVNGHLADDYAVPKLDA